LNEYKTEYIDVFAEIISRFDCLVDIALVIEPDSLPNLATNLANPSCQNSVQSYTEGISYAINTLSEAAPHATLYLDGAHGGWLGWADNMAAFVDIVADLPYQKLRGFATNVANY
jgi:cellulose 1,4-beta-cellobiosidase